MAILQSEDKWILDKRIPIALIGSMAIQVILFAIFLTNLDNRVDAVRIDQEKLEARVLIQEQRTQDVGLKLVRVEEQIKTSNDLLQKIWTRVERSN